MYCFGLLLLCDALIFWHSVPGGPWQKFLPQYPEMTQRIVWPTWTAYLAVFWAGQYQWEMENGRCAAVALPKTDSTAAVDVAAVYSETNWKTALKWLSNFHSLFLKKRGDIKMRFWFLPSHVHKINMVQVFNSTILKYLVLNSCCIRTCLLRYPYISVLFSFQKCSLLTTSRNIHWKYITFLKKKSWKQTIEINKVKYNESYWCFYTFLSKRISSFIIS